MSRKKLIIAGALIALATLAMLVLNKPVSKSLPADKTTGSPAIGGDFALIDQTGRAVNLQTFAGKHVLMFFGFTHCPDVCPTGLATMNQVVAKLGDSGAQIQQVFVTVDPVRDTQQEMAEYLAHFNGITGLTGTPEQVHTMLKNYKIYAQKNPHDGDDVNEYMMDHSSLFYLLDKNGKFVTFFQSTMAVDDMVREIQQALIRDAEDGS